MNPGKNYRLCILANENPLDHEPWIAAINKSANIEYYDIVDLTSDKWLAEITSRQYDIFLLRPPGRTELFKRLYDERVWLIDNYLKTPVYPSLTETLIYENKRFLRDWLTTNHIPHPETNVFFKKDEALSFIKHANSFPLIGKTGIGASGNGVVKLDNQYESFEYINQAFSCGIRSHKGPKISKGSILKKIKKVLNNRHFLRQRLKDYNQSPLDVQYNYVILQKFVPHEYEWRCVRIGGSFFAHKKIARNNKSSGTLIKGYDPVPVSLLNFVREITDKTGLSSAAIDIFEKEEGYLVNEIQCFFGQSDPYQMLVDGKPGRYRFCTSDWLFEEGDFAGNACYDLRLEHALSFIKDK
jgi:glutathione synthase/RimK-type ligase-like ATP-grasp enzyme